MVQENDLENGKKNKTSKKNVSLRDIARQCHVSVSTVSKALNDRRDISGSKKKEIQKAARELNYVPNYMASALKNRYTKNIGVLLSEKSGEGLMQEHFARILNSFKDTVEERGYVITFLNASNSPNRLSYIRQCRYMKFDGVLVLCADYDQDEVKELFESDIPIVSVDHKTKKHVNVASNQYEDMRRMMKFVFDRGHRKIAYIHGMDGEVTRDRLKAYRNFMEGHGLEIPGEYLYTCTYRDTDRAVALTKAVLALPKRPTCILYSDDLTAVSGLSVMQEMGIRVPEDISLAGYDGISIAKVVRPKITTIRQDTISMGIQAGNKLINRIEFPEADMEGETVTVDGMLEPGESVGVCR